MKPILSLATVERGAKGPLANVGWIEGNRARVLFDTCCTANFISLEFVKRMSIKYSKGSTRLVSGIGGVQPILGVARVQLKVLNMTRATEMYVIDTPLYEAMVGLPWLEKWGYCLLGNRFTKQRGGEETCVIQCGQANVEELRADIQSASIEAVWIHGEEVDPRDGDALVVAEEDSRDLNADAGVAVVPLSEDERREAHEVVMKRVKAIEGLTVDQRSRLESCISEDMCGVSLSDLGEGLKDVCLDYKFTDGPVIQKNAFRFGVVLEELMRVIQREYVDSGRWVRGRPEWTSPVFLQLIPKKGVQVPARLQRMW